MRVLVTGATGFIGGSILRVLADAGFEVFGGVRQMAALPAGTPFVTGDLAEFEGALPPVDVVIHAAGLGHRRNVAPAVWRRANVEAAARLAKVARAAGAKKFLLLSTGHIYGRVHDGIVTDDTAPNPMDDYAASKLDAEAAVASAFGPGLTVLRPVAVIGPGCPGNLQLLIRLLRRGVPLPFGAIRNQRSFIDVTDLARLALAIIQAETVPAAVLAAHPEAINTPALIRALAAGLDVRTWILPVPQALLRATAGALGRQAMWQSLAGSFLANPQAALRLGWSPRQSLADSLIETARYQNTTR